MPDLDDGESVEMKGSGAKPSVAGVPRFPPFVRMRKDVPNGSPAALNSSAPLVAIAR
jgi:hypothetical protein